MMMEPIPSNPADHAEDFARRWADRLEEYVTIRMEELGIPQANIGDVPLRRGGRWLAFDPEERKGGTIVRGIVLDSGCLNPNLLKGGKGERVWANARLRDRIDAIIVHEYEEHTHGTHEAALKAAPKTGMPITLGARRILRAMAR